MKSKLFLSILAMLLASIVFVAFKTSKFENVSYKSLSVTEKEDIKRKIINSLKKDSVFSLYNEISNAQIEALAGANISAPGVKKHITLPRASTAAELTRYYKELGLENPELFTKLESVKSLLLVTLMKKYPEFRDMDNKSRIDIIKNSKKTLTDRDKLKRRLIVLRAVQKSNLER